MLSGQRLEVSVTRAAVHMEEKGWDANRYRDAYNRSPSREWEQVCIEHCGAIKEVLACNKL